jgi:cell filamentation protein
MRGCKVFRYSEGDHYVDPESGVLKNLLQISDQVLLDTAEADFVAARSRELALKPLPGKFDLSHLQAIHKRLFGDVYEWAGQLRDVNISKNDTVFAAAPYIESSSGKLFQQLAHEKALAGLGPAEFSIRAAYYFSELNAIHPFREGNGRTQREFISHLAHANGFYIAWERWKQSEMVEASIESFHGKTSKLSGFILANLQPLTESRPKSQRKGKLT